MNLLREYIRHRLLEEYDSLEAYDDDDKQESLLIEPDDSDEEETESEGMLGNVVAIAQLATLGKGLMS